MLFNFDNKFFSTISAIFIPARLTKQFFKGKRQSYVHPVRVLLASTLIMIFALNHTFDGAVIDGPAELYDNLKKTEWNRKKAVELDSIKNNIALEFGEDKNVTAALDSLVIRSHFDDLGEDTIRISKENVNFLHEDIAFAKKDFFNLTSREIVDKYKVKGIVQRTVWQQSIRVIKRGDQLLGFFLGNILWVVVLMMPLLALTLRLLYVWRDFYYVEHLVFSMHTHSFAFALLTAFLFVQNYLPETSIGFIFPIIGIYLPIAMKKFYQQSKRKTILKFILINFTYAILASLVLVLTILLSLAVF